MPNSNARILRSNMTEAENRLWYSIRDRRLGGYKFKRQFPVWPYILDFACHELLIAVEIDGGQHCESEADVKRTEWLAK
jgi:very-short-patch-repair endonuclease